MLFRSEPVLTVFYQSLSAVLSPLPYRTEIIFVNDGSSDGSEERLNRIAESDRRVRALHLSRNFGHQAALCAGLDAASGDYVVTLDSDGQHPPRLIPEMIALAESGYDVVQTKILVALNIELNQKTKKKTRLLFRFSVKQYFVFYSSVKK